MNLPGKEFGEKERSCQADNPDGDGSQVGFVGNESLWRSQLESQWTVEDLEGIKRLGQVRLGLDMWQTIISSLWSLILSANRPQSPTSLLQDYSICNKVCCLLKVVQSIVFDWKIDLLSYEQSKYN